MHNWSVLNNSIRDFTDIPFDKRIHWSFVGTEISNIMRQLEGVHTQEELYDWAAFHQQWHGPTTNKIFFSLLNTLRSRFGDFYIDMLMDIFSEAAYIAQDDRHRKESDYVKLIEHGFSDIFPEFDFVKREAVFQSFRVDLLAMDSISNKSVLFEVKLGADDPTAQLLRYSSFFSNPIFNWHHRKTFAMPKKTSEYSLLHVFRS